MTADFMSCSHPGNYTVTVEKPGFRKVQLTALAINVQDALSRNFTMQIGPVSETVVVKSVAEEINVSPGVSTMVDQEFVENIPLNGRPFQSLLGLTPGSVLTETAARREGQLSGS